MALDEEASGALAGILASLACSVESPRPLEPNSEKLTSISLPGSDSIVKTALEKELSALVWRINALEDRNNGAPALALPTPPAESNATSPKLDDGRRETSPKGKMGPHGRSRSGSKELKASMVNNLLASRPSSNSGTNASDIDSKMTHLTDDQVSLLRDHIQQQDQEIRKLHDDLKGVQAAVSAQREQSLLFARQRIDDVDQLRRELDKAVQANNAFQKALREIGILVTAVAEGDLSKKVRIQEPEFDPEIATFKKTINKMVDQLQDFASQVTFLAKEVGTEGRLGGQACLPGVRGIWSELTDNVNMMAKNLTEQVREIALVTTAVAHGDLSQKIERPAKGEILQLQQTINVMVDNLRRFATEVTRVARDVGTEGVLGGQAQIEGVKGMWNDLTVNVNAMANNLTTQVRDIAKVTTAVAKGDLTQKVSATCKGEILDLKNTINSMVDQLQQFAKEVTNLALEVGTEGRLGGQATVHGVEGTWRDLTHNVNVMAMKLTTQVREIAEVTTAVAMGDLSRKIKSDVKGEIYELKTTINSMVDRLSTFAFEVSKVAREVGTEGTLGGQAKVENVEGKWRDLTDNVNTMARNLTSQVREISGVTQAIAHGDMSKKIHVHAQGEILLLKNTINDMVDRLDYWSLAVQRVARDVGVDGKMGGQAEVEGISGRWKEITVDVNIMAQNLTSQLRAFAGITNAANSGDFSHEITIAASGEMDELKKKINQMVSGLRQSIERNNKARKEAEMANKTKSEFLANMSHEIRTPMNGIIGMTQLALESDLETAQRENLSTVHSLAISLLTIIDDILDISKIEANRMDIERIPFNVRGTVFNALKSLSVKANERGLNLAYEVDSGPLDYVVGDSFRLRQIILNLVGNAIKFTERGQVKVTIKQGKSFDCRPDEYMIEFAVSDTGIGIPESKLDVIFDTFQQADGSTTRRFGGTGLGLSISKKLVNLMGGQLWVSSNYGKGSTFSFTCKYLKADPAIEHIAEKLEPYRSHTVLIWDEGYTDNVEGICEGIRQLSLIPVVYRKGDKALPELRSANGHAYDCIVVGCAQSARELRKIEKFKYIPLVLLASKIDVDFRSALEDGITSYMTTPCLPIDMANALIPALESRATQQKNVTTAAFDILLAEDNPVNQKLAVKILEKHHHRVTVANNGAEAVELVQSRIFDVVLMDVQMPIMGGFEATNTIREWERENAVARTPILALTAHAMLGDRERCLQAEMDDYLSKPLKQTQLLQCIIKYAAMSGAFQHDHPNGGHSGASSNASGSSHKHRRGRSGVASDHNRGRTTPTHSRASSNSTSNTTSSGSPSIQRLKPPSNGASTSRALRPKTLERGYTDMDAATQGMASPAIVLDESQNPFERSPLWRANSS